jgi:urease accessory protein UreF
MQRSAAMSALQFLQLLHLADSALPVGTAAHSFGLESLVVENDLETRARHWAGKRCE